MSRPSLLASSIICAIFAVEFGGYCFQSRSARSAHTITRQCRVDEVLIADLPPMLCTTVVSEQFAIDTRQAPKVRSQVGVDVHDTRSITHHCVGRRGYTRRQRQALHRHHFVHCRCEEYGRSVCLGERNWRILAPSVLVQSSL